MKILITTDLFTMGKPGEINANGVITSVKNLYTELTKIGRTGVKCTECMLSDIVLPEKTFTPISGTVASLRLDAVVSHFAGKGRSQASELITSGFVFVNGVLCEKADMHLSDGDILSVRGHGKATLEVGGKSKKDRIFITLHKYS